MKLRRMRDLARDLGIPRRTFQSWIEKDPSLAVWVPDSIGGAYWVKLDTLAERTGISLTESYTLGASRWIQATVLAELAGISRRTVAWWCRNRPGFAKRLGRIYYVDLESLGASRGDLEALRKRLGMGNSGKDEDEEE